MSKVQPTTESLHFGAIVNEHRELAKMTRAQLASKFPVSPSYIGRTIKGTTRCSYENAEKLDELLNACGHITDAWKKLNSGFPAYYQDFQAKEATASLLRTYSLLLVDGLFQTKEYAFELLRDDKAVANRLKRQEVLQRIPTPMFCLVLDEGVLYRRIGSKETMREQLQHLVEVSQRDGVFVQIAPFAYHRGARSSFSIATQGDDSSTVYIEKTTNGETTTLPAQIGESVRVFARLQSQSLSPNATRDLLRKAIEEKWT
ncbi:helix-turn-helix domain-containing protein [Actinomadura macrotermitis]|uniref:DUF5753 domain-containing protein n=1 Tax=Actinomadura macrotermitis TaxID=2585200 RepID=A0A7K0C1F1_9ACTN|nr:helix-turn-helix transcriptional regulator [Actinomadura macrotermitis]MQY07186.1 hypothetical protein [Actinomadura macrotermitis]